MLFSIPPELGGWCKFSAISPCFAFFHTWVQAVANLPAVFWDRGAPSGALFPVSQPWEDPVNFSWLCMGNKTPAHITCFWFKYPPVQEFEVKKLILFFLGSELLCGKTAKCTQKVGIVGKHGTRRGVSLRKMKKIEISQHAKSTCPSGATQRWREEQRGPGPAAPAGNGPAGGAAGGAWTHSRAPDAPGKWAPRGQKQLKDH